MDRAPIEQPGGEFLTSGRIVLDRREGNKVFVRTLRPDEEDTGEGVNIRAGEQLIFEAGALVINSREIDTHSVKGRGGYAPVANTVWTWYQIVGEQLGFFLFFFSLARRVDAAHASRRGRWQFKNGKKPTKKKPYLGEQGSSMHWQRPKSRS